MKIKENKKVLIIAIVILFLLIVGGTLAYWFWEVDEENKTEFTLEVQGATLTISGGNVTHTGMYPTADCGGEAALIGDVATVTAVNATSSDMDVILRIRASLSVKQGTLTADKKDKINWAIVDTSDGTTCSTTPYKGTMASVTKNTDIDTGIKFIAPKNGTTTKNFRIYVWLDSSYVYFNEGDAVTDPMQNMNISVKFSQTTELIQTAPKPNAPVLDPGMIPVKLANDGTVTTVSSTDSSWYDYENKEWANAVLVNETSRSNYLGTTGVTVNQSDILAYYVWIPRYKYKIPQTVCSSIEGVNVDDYPECYSISYVISSDDDKTSFISWWHSYAVSVGYSEYTLSQATNDVENGLQTGMLEFSLDNNVSPMPITVLIGQYNSVTGESIEYTESYNLSDKVINIPVEIDIQFESTDLLMSEGDAINTYRSHPAFWWDNNNDSVVDNNEIIAGIWVGKFETSTNTDSICYTSESKENCISDNVSPRVLPNVKSLRRQNISNQFITSQKFSAIGNIYGLSNTSTDAHMMKNSEWGAVAYLSHSRYGLNGEVRINNNSNLLTGCGASISNGTQSSSCQISYNSSATPQSTTGNITGIFDMSGGSWEYVMGVFSDNNGNPIVGSNSTSCTGFNGLLNNGTQYTSGIEFPSKKYYDLYTSNDTSSNYNDLTTPCNGNICYGHALSETANWYDDEYGYDGVNFNYNNKWLHRGNIYDEGSSSGIFHVEFMSGGVTNNYTSWRSVIVVGY